MIAGKPSYYYMSTITSTVEELLTNQYNRYCCIGVELSINSKLKLVAKDDGKEKHDD